MRAVDVTGTSLVGYVTTTYQYLVERLGEPTSGPSGDNKVSVSWEGEIDGQVYTIYDWKQTSTPVGRYDWHIGGRSREVVEGVGRLLGLDDRTRRCLY